MLNIQKKRTDSGVVVLEIAGTLGLGRECQQVEWQLEDLLREKETKVVFDFTGLEKIDSTGVGIVVMCHGKLKKAGGELRLSGVTGMVDTVLKMTSVDKIIPFYPTAAAALQGM